MSDLDRSLRFPCGANMPNRFMLAPMTNTQSHADGCLSDDEYHWLTMRAKGGFGIVMTCAAHVQAAGQGFPGQLGIFSDTQLEGHKRLAAGIQAYGSLAVVQLHHAGMRSPEALIGQTPLCPSDYTDPKGKFEARALGPEEVQHLIQDFIDAALRAKRAGYDGVEVHGAHGYILAQFLSPEINQRSDAYGGSPENRARIVVDIIDGIREACGPGFLLGLRVSPERFGQQLEDIEALCRRLDAEHKVDFLDISLWDYRKTVEATATADQGAASAAPHGATGGAMPHSTLLERFADLDFQYARWTVAGKIRSGADVAEVMQSGVDFVTIGRSAILHHDFPKRVMADAHFRPIETPVAEAHLQAEGLGAAFITYMKRWPDFVEKV